MKAQKRFLWFQNHPVEGTRYRGAFDSADDAVAAARAGYDDNIPEGRSPDTYEHIVVEGVVVEKGDKEEGRK